MGPEASAPAPGTRPSPGAQGTVHGPEHSERIPARSAARLLKTLQPLVSTRADASTIFQSTLELVQQLLDVERVSILLLHANEGFLRLRAAIGIPEDQWSQIRIPVGIGVAGRLVEDRVPVLVPDIHDSDFVTLIRADGRYESQSFMAAPIIIHQRVVGVLCATGNHAGTQWTDEDLEVLVAVCDYLAMAVDTAQITQSSQASLTHLKDILATVRLGLITVGEDSRVTMMTSPARQMLGLDERSSVDGRLIVDFFDSADSGVLAVCVGETLEFASESSCEVRSRFPGPDGFPARLEVALMPLVDGEAQCAGALLTLTNLNMRDQLVELRQLDELKSSFLATISHEFRTPLTAIGGATYLLEAMPLEENQRHLSSIIHRNTRRLNRLLENLIELMQIQNGSLQFTPIPCDISVLAMDTVTALSGPAEERKIRVITDLRPTPVVADPILVGKILVELVDNAIKFSPEGTAIAVRTHPDPNTSDALIEIEDSGPGVDATVRRSLFEAFAQGQPYMTRNISGLGMGLNLVRQLVERHGGTIREIGADHPPGESGACFLVRLPAGVP